MRRTRLRATRLLTMLVLGMLGLSLAGPLPASATAPEPVETRLWVDRAPRVQAYGHDVEFVGTLEWFDAVSGQWFAAPAQEVRLVRRAAGREAVRLVGTATTDDTGVIRFRAEAVRNADYWLEYDGGATDALAFGSSVSSTRAVRVVRDLHDRGVEQDGRVYVVGNVDPGWGNRLVTLQRRTCGTCSWTVAARRRTASTGAFRMRLDPRASGAYHYRVLVPSTVSFARSFGRHVYVVRQG